MGKPGRRLLWTLQRRIPGFALAAAAAGLVMLAGPGGSAHAQGTVRSVHGDWQIRCDTPPGAHAEQCVLIQSVTAEDRPNIGLTVIILRTADKKSRIMRVIVRVVMTAMAFRAVGVSRRLGHHDQGADQQSGQ